jgi:hypothetical protein
VTWLLLSKRSRWLLPRAVMPEELFLNESFTGFNRFLPNYRKLRALDEYVDNLRHAEAKALSHFDSIPSGSRTTWKRYNLTAASAGKNLTVPIAASAAVCWQKFALVR